MTSNEHNQAVREFLAYDPATGAITWKKRPARAAAVGALATFDNGRGYLQLTLRGKRYNAHRVGWFLSYGEWPSKTIDHINGNRSDNSLENLREATYAENNRAVGLRRINKSGAKGVSYHARKRMYEAAIWVDRKKIYLGQHATVDEAAHEYNKAAVRFHGEFAVLNPIGEAIERRLLGSAKTGEANG